MNQRQAGGMGDELTNAALVGLIGMFGIALVLRAAGSVAAFLTGTPQPDAGAAAGLAVLFNPGDPATALGADLAVDYSAEDYVEAVKGFTGGKGVNVVLDMVAGSYVTREIECLAEDGRLVIIAVQGGVNSEFNAGLVLRRRLTITGSTLRPRPVASRKAAASTWPRSACAASSAIKAASASTCAAA